MADIVEEVKAAAGDRYVAILGQQAGRAVLDADFLDEMRTHLTPLILGDGLRMFERAESTERLRLIRAPTGTGDRSVVPGALLGPRRC